MQDYASAETWLRAMLHGYTGIADGLDPSRFIETAGHPLPYEDWVTWQRCRRDSSRRCTEYLSRGAELLDQYLGTLSARKGGLICVGVHKDELLAHLKGPLCSPYRRDTESAVIRHNRFVLTALKKWRKEIPNVSAEMLKKECISEFLGRNAEMKAFQSSPFLKENWRIIAGMRRVLARALPKHDRPLQPTFSGGAVAERLPLDERWMEIGGIKAFDPRTLSIISNPKSESPICSDLSSRVCAVFKTAKKWRIITIEPFTQLYGQHAARKYIYECIHSGPLRGSSMDLMGAQEARDRILGRRIVKSIALNTRHDAASEDLQEHHRRWALEGSRTGGIATLDMKDASDRNCYDLVAATFPAHCMELLDRFRTPAFRVDGEDHTAYMYAGMGNATTFVVETLLYWAFCVASSEFFRCRSNPISAFGDDIVCGSDLAGRMIDYELFQRLGFSVNVAKSYYKPDTRYRESCGVYAFNGEDVTVPRIYGYDRSMFDQIALADLVNRLARTPVPIAVQLAHSVAADCGFPNLPVPVENTRTIHVTSLPWDTTVPTRWNTQLHKTEYKLKQLEAQSKRVGTEGIHLLLARLANSVGETDVQKKKLRKPKAAISREGSPDDGPRKVAHSVRIPVRGEHRQRFRWLG